MRKSLNGRASASQADSRGFDSRLSLQHTLDFVFGRFFSLFDFITVKMNSQENLYFRILRIIIEYVRFECI